MARVPTDQETVLTAVVDRLITQVHAFGDKNCFLTAAPLEEIPENVRDQVVCTVSPTDSQFEMDVHEGAGIFSTIEDAGVILNVFNAVKLDRVGHDAAALTHESRGLLRLKHEILKALSGHDLKNDAGEQILANVMAPMNSGAPRSYKQKLGLVSDLSVTFSCDFEWDLT